ncbi:hypothetical protein YPC_0903 [Yersinia pestis biovar Medievalis str. Harbin 35]|nr:hypothetical protein YPC_0903 [Yersinia pestis biovar Medievalis str. Harbin 35]EEO75591.1 hypothetical protein YP516_3520 [Yersinia pestis Nepal516]EEO82991.1 hypothetical protein YPF_0970 [Yersinia pestis biovar Orientalis str. India 195]EEO87227.1 hypothetical protein YPH_3163 [Yersinia pestis biovar Orientalis str. PEXU2]EEO91289.1 hypothetical protein YPS_1514 [Yersinia pestis Pestoides A]QOW12867.1 hypothetical protein S96127_0560 [Yersinia pestis]
MLHLLLVVAGGLGGLPHYCWPNMVIEKASKHLDDEL